MCQGLLLQFLRPCGRGMFRASFGGGMDVTLTEPTYLFPVEHPGTSPCQLPMIVGGRVTHANLGTLSLKGVGARQGYVVTLDVHICSTTTKTSWTSVPFSKKSRELGAYPALHTHGGL